jgi:rare lipoprotein A
VVFERRYVPMTALEPYRERGVATWYGRRYHGQRTSNGEVYDMYAMTAAHPTLPIPSYVRVTHLGNGRSVVVRVNDRGPFLNGRLIDLSYTAAAKLGYVNAGSAEVEVELITRFGGDGGGLQASAAPAPGGAAGGSAGGSASTEGLATGPERLQLETVVASVSPNPPSTPAPGASPSGAQPSSPGAASFAGTSAVPGAAPASAGAAAPPAASAGVYLQFGAFSSRESAESTRARLARDLAGLVKDVEVRHEGSLFKVHAGPYPARVDALAAAERIERAGRSRPVVVTR